MSSYLPSRDGLLRSNLADTIKRLKRIQKKAGKQDPEDEEQVSTGDPFSDIGTSFVILVTKTKAAIHKRNMGCRLHGVDRISIEEAAVIRRNISEMERMASQLQDLLNSTEKEYTAAAGKKKRNQPKIDLLKKALDEKRSQYQDCLTTIDVVKEMNRELIAPGGDAATDITFGKKAKLREQLSSLDFSSAASKYRDDNGGGGANATRSGRLEDNDEYRRKMAEIKEQDEKIDAGLDRLREGMARLKDISTSIGEQLNAQNLMLQETENMLNRQSQQLYNISNRITKLMKESSPINTFMYCCCVILILAIVGFVLLQFNII